MEVCQSSNGTVSKTVAVRKDAGVQFPQLPPISVIVEVKDQSELPWWEQEWFLQWLELARKRDGK